METLQRVAISTLALNITPAPLVNIGGEGS